MKPSDPSPLPPATPPAPDPAQSGPPVRTATFRQTASAVFWSFFGVRKRRESEKDIRLNPVHVIIMGLLAGVVFVLTLLSIVALIMRNA